MDREDAASNILSERLLEGICTVGIYRPHIPWYVPRLYFDKHPYDEVVIPEVLENDLDDVPEAGQEMARRHWHQWMVENDKWQEAVQAYHAAVSFTDDMVGRLLTALKNGPHADNTVIVLWSDNGYHLGQKEHWEKFALWEQTTRVPMIVTAPNVSGAGKVCRQAVSLLDIYPTLVDLCGSEMTQDSDGKSLMPLLANPDQETGRAVVCTEGFNNHAIRSDRWRYIRYEDGSEELYDHQNDGREFHNLANDEAYDDVKEELTSWLPKHNEEPHPTANAQR